MTSEMKSNNPAANAPPETQAAAGVLTEAEALAILKVRAGADVYDYGLALTLRSIQRRGLRRLLEFTKPLMYDGDGTDRMPYFGVKPTRAGLKAARMALGAAR